MNEEELYHYGTLHKSGRYPWGSGENAHQRHKMFLDHVKTLEDKGLSQTDIAKGLGISTTQLRASKSIAKDAVKAADRAHAEKLRATGMSNVAIGDKMGINESSVRALLNPANKEKQDILKTTANTLREAVDSKGFIDVGMGVENHLGISREKLGTAVEMLREEGYAYHKFDVEQQGTGFKTNFKVLAPPGTTYPQVLNNKDKITQVMKYSDDNGRSFNPIETPRNVDSKRINVRYGPNGGADKDGVIEIRRGVDDISLGGARYAQVRVAVDGTHYLKGMAMYSDKMPPGVDMIFNTNKSDTGNKLDAMKPMKDDPDNPFGSIVRQRKYTDAEGKQHLSAMNIVNEEGAWRKWGDTLSSQMLSKQRPSLAKEQLAKVSDRKQAEYEEIMALTNPAVRKKLLHTFSEEADSAAVKLKAASLPRQGTHVILPVTTLKDTEVYAPNYDNGERVVLIRHPHGGIFEIPELTVNNRHPEARKILGRATDAIGIHPNVAARLSGADFDGDTVLVIPNNHNKVKTAPPLASLKDFDTRAAYPNFPGMKVMSDTQKQMGDISNLITDMTIKGAPEAHIAKAVKHSMVVIDAEKHKLNYKQSYIDQGIAELKTKYQGAARNGASTLVSLASSEARVPERKARSAKEGGPIDKATGRKMYTPTNDSYVNKAGKVVQKTTKSTKMAEALDAHSLSSGTPMEAIYADHANKLKAMANEARKSEIMVKPTPYSPSAKIAYSSEVKTLDSKLTLALRNKPLERQAQVIAGSIVKAKMQANPDMPKEDLKKVKSLAQQAARERMGAKKIQIEITPNEWDAIQAGAISNNKLTQILNNTDMEKLKQLANPRSQTLMTDSKLSRAQSMLDTGKYTQAEVARALGISTSTLNAALHD